MIPTFSEIANGLVAAGCVPRAFVTDRAQDFQLEAKDVIDSLHFGADAIFIGRPNSPTGAMISFAVASEIATQAAKEGAWCIFDEAFVDFVADTPSVVPLLAANPKVIVLRSLTKIFAIPGLRLGCLVAKKSVLANLREALEPWSTNVVAEQVGIACLDDVEETLQRTRQFVTAERAYLLRELSQLRSLRVFPSVANFVMVEALDERQQSEMANFLLRRGIAIRDLSNLPGCGPGLYRIAVRARAENGRLLSELSAYNKFARE